MYILTKFTRKISYLLFQIQYQIHYYYRKKKYMCVYKIRSIKIIHINSVPYINKEENIA